MELGDILDEYKIKMHTCFSFSHNDFKDVIAWMPEGAPGAYIMFDESNRPLYIGVTKCLKKRLYCHSKGNTKSTKEHFRKFDKFTIINAKFTRYELGWLEALLIYYFKPTLNTHLNKKWWIEHFKSKYLKTCEKCGRYAYMNGFCYHHGGEGKKWQDYVAEDMKKLGF